MYYVISSTNKLHLSASIIHDTESNRRPGLCTKHLLKREGLDLWASFSDRKSREHTQYTLCISYTMLCLEFVPEGTTGPDLVLEGLNSMPVVPY